MHPRGIAYPSTSGCCLLSCLWLGPVLALLLEPSWSGQYSLGVEIAASACDAQHSPFDVPVDCGAAKACMLRVVASFSGRAPASPLPIVILFTGFQMPRSWYDSYAQTLACSGDYVVLQYETSSSLVKPVIPDRIEVQFIPVLLSHAARMSADISSPLRNRVDVCRVGLLGHSRGAKLAALALASGVRLRPSALLPLGSTGPAHQWQQCVVPDPPSSRYPDHEQQQQQQQQQQEPDSHACHAEASPADCVLSRQPGAAPEQSAAQGTELVPQLVALLVDPVDSGGGDTQEGAQYPSAVRALAGRNRSAAVVGAGISGWCNPENKGWRAFWPVLASGWLQVISAAGHLQFTDAQGATAWAWDKFCGGGAMSHAGVEEFPARAALAWFGLAFAGKPPTGYIDWSLEQQEAQQATFEVKGTPGAGYAEAASSAF